MNQNHFLVVGDEQKTKISGRRIKTEGTFGGSGK